MLYELYEMEKEMGDCNGRSNCLHEKNSKTILAVQSVMFWQQPYYLGQKNRTRAGLETYYEVFSIRIMVDTVLINKKRKNLC